MKITKSASLKLNGTKFYLTKKFNSGLIIMHTPAAPKIMQTKTKDYKNIYSDIKKSL